MDIQWPLAVFTLLTGLAGWTFFFVGLNEFTKKSKQDGFVVGIASIVLLAIGSLASVLHLSHPDRIMNALSHPTSGIFTEFVLVMLLGVSILASVVCLKRGWKGAVKAFAVLGMVFGVLISFMAGYSYIMAGREAWDTVLLPTAYLGTAIPMGAALYWALATRGGEPAPFAAVCTAVGGGAALLATLAYALATGVFAGEGLAYACLCLCCSGAIPLVCGLMGRGGSKPALAWAALVAALVGGLVFRIMMWIVGSGFYGFFG